jgi:hypothetical protein
LKLAQAGGGHLVEKMVLSHPVLRISAAGEPIRWASKIMKINYKEERNGTKSD